ncbi:hypothetical protein Glove_196g120 [Diversispora epigaea]|uniref:Uncharacterized protein n=1 Tax=Diversispora epigaea TaxID=1348612 RepID=A0A397IUB5_9GLOM|nr:hypothetical protein Glove_196g120 [Diversispora epigaea]
MLEQNYDNSSSPFSSHSIYLTNNNEINNEKELFNEMLTWTDDDTSDTSSISDINFEDLEDFENETSDQESNNEIFEQEIDEIIDIKFTPCVIVDFINNKIQRCNETQKLRPLHNLFGIWQVDRDAIKEVDNVLSKLGVCVGCSTHSWYLNEQNIQVPCIGQYTCKALQLYPPFCKRAFNDIKKPICICCSCYENLGGHIYHCPGRGKKATTCITENLHDNNITKGLKFLGNWLINIAQTDNNEIKKNILIETFKTLHPFVSPLNQKFTNNFSTSINSIVTKQEKSSNEIPSLFLIKILFMKVSKKKSMEMDFKITDFEKFGHMFGQKLWDSRSDVNSKKLSLESPQTIQKYYNSFPKFLNSFFYGIIDELYKKKLMVCNWQRKRHEKVLKTTDSEGIIKIVTFITSILLGLVFPHLKIWLPRVLASFSPNPTKRLIQGKNIWNLAIIDNIDFKEKSFKFGNIYDVTRGNSHTTLRMAFQAQLPFEVETGPEPVVELTAETPLFGMNQGINEILRDFDAEVVKHTILNKIDHGCLGPTPHIVILEPGANPNSDEEILHVATMYKDDFKLENHSFLDIVGDQAIYSRMIRCREEWPNLRPLLGQWHTSKDFYKFEAAVDYRATSQVLDLIWVAVGVAINIYIVEKGILFNEIMEEKNNTHICLQIWYMYYKWAGIWKAHRTGMRVVVMRVGNFDLQQNSLSAAGPLYASAAKSNYTTAIAHFLSTIATYPRLEEKLRYCSAFKISNKDRHICFGFDEALETFGGNVIDETNLNNQIKASQDERERIDLLLSEYLDDRSVSYCERAVKSRKESLWELIDDLVTVFGMAKPLSHKLFQEYTPTQMHPEGLKRLIACYPDGLKRIKEVYRQDVLGIERRNTKGRRAVGVVKTKLKDYNDQKKTKRKRTATNLIESEQAENSNNI